MSTPTDLTSRGGIRDLPPDWAPGTEWTPPSSPDGGIDWERRGVPCRPPRAYRQPDRFRPTLHELASSVRHLWRYYRQNRGNP